MPRFINNGKIIDFCIYKNRKNRRLSDLSKFKKKKNHKDIQWEISFSPFL
jgi:hypothetical protein